VSDDRREELRRILQQSGLSGRVLVGSAAPAPEVLPRSSSRLVPTLDERLGIGRIPSRGQLIELVGDASSGRTALAYRMAAGTVAGGALAAWVDLPNALDPRFLRRTGIDLRSLLWVHPPGLQAALKAADLLARTGFATVVLDLDGAAPGALAKLGATPWTRLLRSARENRASVVLLASERCVGSAAGLALYTERRQARFEAGLFEGFDACASVLRDRARAGTADRHALHVLHRRE